MNSPVPLRFKFEIKKWGQACLKTLQILSHESSAKLTEKCSGPVRDASSWICQPRMDKYLLRVDPGPNGLVPSKRQANLTMLMASSVQIVISLRIDRSIDKITNNKGSSKCLEREKQASQGDAKLHFPMKAKRAAALKV
jgi:hypothetical protein